MIAQFCDFGNIRRAENKKRGKRNTKNRLLAAD